MPIPFETIEIDFIDAVMRSTAFADWKRRGKRCIWKPIGDLHHGIELVRFKASFENKQWIAVGSFVSFPCPEKPSGYVSSELWKGGRKFVRAYLVPGRGMVPEPTFGSGAVVKLEEPDASVKWAEGLTSDLGAHVVPWLQQRQALEDVGQGLD